MVKSTLTITTIYKVVFVIVILILSYYLYSIYNRAESFISNNQATSTTTTATTATTDMATNAQMPVTQVYDENKPVPNKSTTSDPYEDEIRRRVQIEVERIMSQSDL